MQGRSTEIPAAPPLILPPKSSSSKRFRQRLSGRRNIVPYSWPFLEWQKERVHGDNFPAKRIRKLVHRRSVDYTSTVVRYMQIRMWQRDARDRTVLQPTPAAAIDMLPTVAYSDNPSTSFATKFAHASTNKNRCSINRIVWTPTGRRLITGSQSGEFTLWNGQSFNFEMILQAHDQAIRSMVWSHNENWMVTGDDGGSIKYWQNNMNNVKVNKSAHGESVRDLSFSRTDLKFCSCSDDNTVKVWDFARCQEERSLAGHGWDVKSVDWHPTKSLLASGGKDNLVKLWDAKTGRELCSLHGHKNTVLSIKWNQNGNWVLTASKDQIIKLYDIRSMKELESFRGHRKDVTALAWHPFHEEYFVSGSFDGSIFHWLVGHETPQVEVHNAHDNSVWDLAWHPIGYILCSGSNDHTTKFWCRNRPGDSSDKQYFGHSQGPGEFNNPLAGRSAASFSLPETPSTPGPFAAGLSRNEGTIPGVGLAMPLSIPSLDTSDQAEQRQPLPVTIPAGVPHPPSVPHPSLIASGQQAYQQIPRQVPPQLNQPQALPQQMVSLPLPPPTLPHLQPPSLLPLLAHPHFPRPPPPLPPRGMPLTTPSSLPGSLPMPSSMAPSLQLPMPSQMVMQGSANQIIPPLPQAHIIGMNPMHSGSVSGNNITPAIGGFSNGIANVQGLSSASGPQTFSIGGAFNRPQSGQLAPVPGYGAYQSAAGTMMDVRASSMNLGSNIGIASGLPQPPPPPPPPTQPRGSTP